MKIWFHKTVQQYSSTNILIYSLEMEHTHFIPIVGVGIERSTKTFGPWRCKGGTRYSNYLEDY